MLLYAGIHERKDHGLLLSEFIHKRNVAHRRLKQDCQYNPICVFVLVRRFQRAALYFVDVLKALNTLFVERTMLISGRLA